MEGKVKPVRSARDLDATLPASDKEIAALRAAIAAYPEDDSPVDSDIADTGITPAMLLARIEADKAHYLAALNVAACAEQAHRDARDAAMRRVAHLEKALMEIGDHAYSEDTLREIAKDALEGK